MATLLPPPKRQKQFHGVPEPDKEPVRAAPNVVVQFVSEEDGKAIAPSVNLPADVPREDLERLVNQLNKTTDEPVPFSFHLALPGEAGTPNAQTRVTIQRSIADDVLARPKEFPSFSQESIFTLVCAPQAVFRVRPATRCSSTLSGHGSPILCASFSPTGSTLATGAGDNTARLWDLDTETPSHTLTGHVGWVLCVEWEARERTLASGGHDGHVRLWDPRAGTAKGPALKGHTKWVTSLAWEPIHLAPANPRLASSSKDGTVRVWEPSTRRCAFTLGGHSASVNVVRWGGTGRLYTASNDRTVRIWDASTGRVLHTLKDHAHWVTTLALSTDFVLRTGPFSAQGPRPAEDDESMREAAGKRYFGAGEEMLITGSDDHTLFLWDGQGNKKGRLTGHQRQVVHVAFSPDGRWAASGGFDSAVRIWNGRTGKFIATLRGHVGPVYRLTWSADSRLLVSASKDSTVKIWDLKTYKLKTDLPGHTDEVYCVDFVADKIVSGGKDKTVKM